MLRNGVQFGKSIRDIPAVSRMLLSMRGEIEAARALIYETSVWVDLYKAYDHYLATADKKDKDARKRQKQTASLADALTPLTKYYATEMGNRVCYQAMQVHGGVGYMREFNVERHYRDIRVTNIYEGTSQLQIVAVIGKLLGGALDELLNGLAGLDYGPALDTLKQKLVEATEKFREAAASLKENEREIIDYYSCGSDRYGNFHSLQLAAAAECPTIPRGAETGDGPGLHYRASAPGIQRLYRHLRG